MKIILRNCSMKLLEMIFVVAVICLFASSFFGGFALLEKEKLYLDFLKKYEAVVFIDQDFKAKSKMGYFLSPELKDEWMLFIENYFSLESIRFFETSKGRKFCYDLEFFLSGEKYTIKYAGRLDEKI